MDTHSEIMTAFDPARKSMMQSELQVYDRKAASYDHPSVGVWAVRNGSAASGVAVSESSVYVRWQAPVMGVRTP